MRVSYGFMRSRLELLITLAFLRTVTYKIIDNKEVADYC